MSLSCHWQREIPIQQKISTNFLTGNNKVSCEVYPAPFAVFLNRNDHNYLEPDISVICDADKLTEYVCNGAPDWIIEIVSPSSQRMDYQIKLSDFLS